MNEHPARPQLVVRVGVTGHRQGESINKDSLADAVRTALAEIRTIAKEAFDQNRELFDKSQELPVLRLISPLADGADMLVAREAINQKFDLQVPLPFTKSQYEMDQQDKEEFQKLYDDAKGAVFELDNPVSTGEEKDAGYEAAGRLMLRQSDVVIALWNGAPAKGIGGTGQIVQEALAAEIPTLRIDVHSHAVTLLNPKRTASSDAYPERIELLRERLLPALLPHSGNPDPEEQARAKKEAESFFSERKLIRWRRATELPQALAHPRDEIFRIAFEWADNLAKRYAFVYRWSYRLIYSLGALAVLLAYLGSTAESLPEGLRHEHQIFLAAEFGVIVLVGALAALGRFGRWHERWLDYRHLAESLRMMRLLVLLGRVTSFFQVPAHLGKGDPRKTWFYFYLRALIRQAGLVSIKVDESYRKAFRDHLYDRVCDQQKYHAGKAARCHLTHKVWHTLAQGLFGIAAAACLLHFNLHGNNTDPKVLALNLAVIVLPAFGGAIGAILHQGESERIMRRSEALGKRLDLLEAELQGQIPSAQELGRLAEDFSRICLGELMDWRFLFLDRPLVLPA